MSHSQTPLFEVYTTLNTGAKIPVVGFGTVCPAENRAAFKDVLVTAIEAGYRHIDTAWRYETEPIIGEALKEVFSKGIIKREDLFITTKVWPTMHNNPLKSLNISLEAMGIEYVDLFLQHWPLCFAADLDGKPMLPTDENGDFLVQQGADYLDTYGKMVEIYKTTDKVKSIGVSNFRKSHLEALLGKFDVVPAANQLELHPCCPEVELVEYCKEKGIVPEAYAPLGSDGAPNLKLPLVVSLAQKYSVNPVDILVSYHAVKGRCVLPRSQNIERIKKGFVFVPLTDDENAALDNIGLKNPKRCLSSQWAKALNFQLN